MSKIRRAVASDARGIHKAHMRSIQGLCNGDYSPNEIIAWGHRPFEEDVRLRAIRNDFVWVVESDGIVQGYAELRITNRNGFKEGHVWGLYLVPELKGRGYGRRLCETLIAEAQQAGVGILRLESTVTARDFYRKAGFIEAGPEMKVMINGESIRCFPMVQRI